MKRSGSRLMRRPPSGTLPTSMRVPAASAVAIENVTGNAVTTTTLPWSAGGPAAATSHAAPSTQPAARLCITLYLRLSEAPGRGADQRRHREDARRDHDDRTPRRQRQGELHRHEHAGDAAYHRKHQATR